LQQIFVSSFGKQLKSAAERPACIFRKDSAEIIIFRREVSCGGISCNFHLAPQYSVNDRLSKAAAIGCLDRVCLRGWGDEGYVGNRLGLGFRSFFPKQFIASYDDESTKVCLVFSLWLRHAGNDALNGRNDALGLGRCTGCHTHMKRQHTDNSLPHMLPNLPE
jgi:hypothetical protein